MAKIARELPTPRIIRLLRADDGAAAIEYGLLAALIAGMILIGLTALGSDLNGQFTQVVSAMAGDQSASSGGGGSGGGGSAGGSSGNNGNGKGYGKGGNGNGNNGNGNGNGGSAA
jgi:Flp pilus assembly pilin Flp